MLCQQFIENIFRYGLAIVSSNHINNHQNQQKKFFLINKTINKRKFVLKKWGIHMEKRKRTQKMISKKDNL